MNVSVNWVRELAPGITGSTEELARRFSLVAAAVEGQEPVGEGLADIVVARVLTVRPHPNADRLSLCTVDAGGGEVLDVVCGAPVVVEGALYPYVGVGTTLPGGLTIESRKIRGEISNGMLCSENELGIGRDRGGIMRLPDGLAVGSSIAGALGLPDTRLALDLNPNRVDLACHAGVARELAPEGDAGLAYRDFGARWTPEWRDGESAAEGAGVEVRIDSPERCPRYLAAVIRGVRVGPSPAWLAGRLLAVGGHPINNVVDATNYVLLERNQPLHAFDLATIGGTEIRVRAAAAGETLRTLDGAEHRLATSATVIADRDRAIALAGVMGGELTQVTSATADILIECALFDPASVRATARSCGVSTDASYRFERGVDARGQEEALVRTVELILAVAGGEAVAAAPRVGPRPAAPAVLRLRAARVTQVLGLTFSTDELGTLLRPLGFTTEPPGGDELDVGVPGWRTDVTREIDLVEEVARRHGFDNFPRGEPTFRSSAVPSDPLVSKRARVRELLAARGFLEARSLTFVPEEHGGSRAFVAVPNPLSAEESFLRHSIVPVLLGRLEHNYARGRRDVRLYEVGTVFSYAPDPVPSANERDAGLGRFVETRRAGAVVTGARHPPHWSAPSVDWDLWDARGLADEIATRLCGGSVEVDGGPAPGDDRFGAGWLGPERFRLLVDSVPIGVAGAVRPGAIDAPPWAAPSWAIEFDLDAVETPVATEYRPLSAFPAVRRDMAVTVPVGVRASAVEQAVRETASALLTSVRLFDVYEGVEAGEGRRSLGWAFRFRAHDRTLTDDDVEAEIRTITAALEERFDARIRRS